MEITITYKNRIYEPHEQIPAEIIIIDNKSSPRFKSYELCSARRLPNIEGLILMATIKIEEYNIFNRNYTSNNIRAAIQGNKIIPLLRISEGSERKLSKSWPIII